MEIERKKDVSFFVFAGLPPLFLAALLLVPKSAFDLL